MALADNPWKLKDFLAALNARNITLPAEVTAAVDKHHKVAAAIPAVPPATALRDAIANDPDDPNLAAILLDHIAGNQLTDAWRSASNLTALHALELVTAHRDTIHAQLAHQANACIQTLNDLAALGSGVTLDDLVRQGHPAAKQWADRETTAAELRALYSLRDQHLLPPGVRNLTIGGFDYSRWRNPDVAEHHAQGPTLADATLAALRAGAQLHFPTAEAALELAQQAWDAYEAEAIERQKAQHGIGSTVAWG